MDPGCLWDGCDGPGLVCPPLSRVGIVRAATGRAESPGAAVSRTLFAVMMRNGSAAQVLAWVHERTGKPVRVEPDRALPPEAPAQLIPARGGAPFHRIAIHPGVIQQPEYHVVFQAGLFLRRWAVPPALRRDFAERPKADETARRWMLDHPHARNVIDATHPRLIRLLCSGLLRQLQTTPLGLRVDDWIRRDHPDLAPLQRKAIERQLNDNAAGLRPEVQRAMPGEALRASLGMNAAFALYWSRALDLPRLVIPYRTAGYEKVGIALLDAWDRIPSGPEADDDLVDAWADLLAVRDWYQWIEEPAP
jgi:hypothetical protein